MISHTMYFLSCSTISRFIHPMYKFVFKQEFLMNYVTNQNFLIFYSKLPFYKKRAIAAVKYGTLPMILEHIDISHDFKAGSMAEGSTPCL